MKGRRLALLLMGILAVALSGCFGPIERPVADFTWCPNGFAGDLDYQFSSTSTTVPGHWIESMVWEFDDGTPPDAAWDAWHRFEESETYHVTLTVTDSRGVSGTVTKEVPVFLVAEIYPNWHFTLGWPIRITGIVANRAEVRLNSVVVRAKFYDVDGVRLTDGTVTLTDMEPGEKVAFTVDAAEYSARIFHATVEIDSFVADCRNPWFIPVAEYGTE
ncbi:PKD domain-containing protein [Candidatus Bipolaricaulota bacterium]|nr:PKD domain-containing protein [Candidatus Bipolaricaulota bacterium]MCK5585899.1 PKD domain-containing protein [Candidatus Bipolaricaulota bacterium]